MSYIKRLLEEVREQEEADLIEEMHKYFKDRVQTDEQYLDAEEYFADVFEEEEV